LKKTKLFEKTVMIDGFWSPAFYSKTMPADLHKNVLS